MVHILCHDLANPFANMKIVLSIMGDKPEELARYLPDLAGSADQGMELINLVRRMRALDEKGLTIGQVDLADAWVQSSSMLASRFEEKGITLETRGLDQSLPVRAEAASLVNSVLNNLLTNAMKFSHRGGKVTIRAEKNDREIVLTLEDEGMGIPEDILAILFDPAKTTHREGTEGEGGTGFGMPLVRKFMRAYGGDIRIRSEENKGTTVVLTFPREIEE